MQAENRQSPVALIPLELGEIGLRDAGCDGQTCLCQASGFPCGLGALAQLPDRCQIAL